MNELGAKALEWLRARPNVMGMSDEDLVAWCERTGQEMAADAARLADSIFQRMENEARDAAGKAPSDGDTQAAMLRTARASAERMVLQERVYDLAAAPASRRIGDWVSEDPWLMEIEWDPDWHIAMEVDELPGVLGSDPENWEGLVDLDDPYTWSEVTDGYVQMIWDSHELNAALAEGRLVWGPGDTLVPKVRVDRLRAEAEARGEPDPGIPRGD